jgi:hypothetical protein
VDEFFVRLRPVYTTPLGIPSVTFKNSSISSKIYSITFKVLFVAFKTGPAIFNRFFQGAVHIDIDIRTIFVIPGESR